MLLWKDWGAGQTQTVWTEALLSHLLAARPGASCLLFPSFSFFNCPLGVLTISPVDGRIWTWFMNCNAVLLGGIGISEDQQGGAEAAGPRVKASPRQRGELKGGGSQTRTGTRSTHSLPVPGSSGKQKAKGKQWSWLESSRSFCWVESLDGEGNGSEP